MADSHAQASDDDKYDNDDFFDNPEDYKNVENAVDYFEKLEKQSKLTPEGQNSNADGGSIFNQTGGRFLDRSQRLATHSSQQPMKEKLAKTMEDKQITSNAKIDSNILRSFGPNIHASAQ